MFSIAEQVFVQESGLAAYLWYPSGIVRIIIRQLGVTSGSRGQSGCSLGVSRLISFGTFYILKAVREWSTQPCHYKRHTTHSLAIYWPQIHFYMFLKVRGTRKAVRSLSKEPTPSFSFLVTITGLTMTMDPDSGVNAEWLEDDRYGLVTAGKDPRSIYLHLLLRYSILVRVGSSFLSEINFLLFRLLRRATDDGFANNDLLCSCVGSGVSNRRNTHLGYPGRV